MGLIVHFRLAVGNCKSVLRKPTLKGPAIFFYLGTLLISARRFFFGISKERRPLAVGGMTVLARFNSGRELLRKLVRFS